MINSMTGFAATVGDSAAGRWSWEIKTVNAKGLDIRLRLPPGFDAVEMEARRMIGARLVRGTCHATLVVTRESTPSQVRINTDVLTSLVRALHGVVIPPTIRPASLDGLLAVRGVVESFDPVPDEAAALALRAACITGLDQALDGLTAMRATEGAALLAVLNQRIETVAGLTRQANDAPERQVGAVQEKLAHTIATLSDRYKFDPDRLHQEALILAAKADVREELDRLTTHVVAVRALFGSAGAVGRRLDFLAQELAREANTFCAKVNDAALTAIGLELRVEIEQFREQVQNIE